MTPCRFAPLRLIALAAVAAPLFAAQALASGPNEYTMSPSETSAAVTTYQTQTYQAPAQTYQPQPAEPAAPQFGEIIFDTQPYMPNADSGTTESYTTQTYTGETQIQTYQPAPLQPVQPTYMPSATN